MTTAISVEEFKKGFAGTDRIMALFQVQGDISNGFSQIEEPEYREIFGDPNMPNYQKSLASSVDTGGQTCHVFEKLFHTAQMGVPSIMFGMARDPELKEPRIEQHSAAGCYVVYLPHSVFHEAGIPEDKIYKNGPDQGLVSKETLMANPKVFDVIARHALNFLEQNVPDFNRKKMLFLSGHYVDGGQSVLQLKKKIAQEARFQGNFSAIWNPHTMGIDKMQSLLKKELEQVQAYLAGFNEATPERDALVRHPVIQDQWDILATISSGAAPDVVAAMVGKYLANLEKQMPDFLDAYERMVAKYRVNGSIDKLAVLSRDEMENCMSHTLPALNQTYSFKSRLELEGPDQARGFDGLAVTSEKMKGQMKDWIGNDPLFVRSGIDQTIFRPDAIQPGKEDVVLSCAANLINQAWVFDNCPGAEVTPEKLKDATVFTAISRPDERKGSDLAIEAFARYMSTHPKKNAYLVFGAHKPLSPEDRTEFFHKLENMVCAMSEKYDIDLKSRVKFLPALKSYECRTLYALPRAIGLSPSQNEPWGIVGVEQLASGIPVIASDEYASVRHFGGKKCAAGSVRFFPSPIRTEVAREETIDKFAAAMDDVSRNYVTMKSSAELFAQEVLNESSWRSMAERYNRFMTDLCLRKKVIPAADLGIRAMLIQDVDGSLTPYIHEPEDTRRQHVAFEALKRQTAEIRQAGGLSVLTSGRPLAMLQQDGLLKDYTADYAITSAGVEISRREGNALVPDKAYEKFLLTPPTGKDAFDREAISNALRAAPDLTPQPEENVTGQRLGYYMDQRRGDTVGAVRTRVQQQIQKVIPQSMDYRFDVSLDPEIHQWNIDITPSKATGKSAVEWLIRNVKESKRPIDTAIVCGDSTGDIISMEPQIYLDSGIQPAFIAPANAADDVRSALTKFKDRRNGPPVHFFTGPITEFHHEHGGPGGLLEGLCEVMPKLKEKVRGQNTPPSTHVEEPVGQRVSGAGRGK